jgi:hypothetical protein
MAKNIGMTSRTEKRGRIIVEKRTYNVGKPLTVTIGWLLYVI